jgi:hypothetical protein
VLCILRRGGIECTSFLLSRIHQTNTTLLLNCKGLAVPASYNAEVASVYGRIWRLGLSLTSSSSVACACIYVVQLLLRNFGKHGAVKRRTRKIWGNKHRSGRRLGRVDTFATYLSKRVGLYRRTGMSYAMLTASDM